MKRSSRAIWLLLAVAITTLDLWSKEPWLYPHPLPGGEPVLQEGGVLIENWLYIRTVWNEGAVWSLRLGTGLLFWVTALATPFLLLWILLPARTTRVEVAGKALLLGGAAGNLYDRWRYGAVRDFIDVCFGNPEGWHWPTFNVADIALVAGIALLLLFGFKRETDRAAA
ncbi:MAG: signal peptidase II [Planctomycetes bacterium]|nr:signal peptidase II [Planctomycetota bacterium]